MSITMATDNMMCPATCCILVMLNDGDEGDVCIYTTLEHINFKHSKE